MQTSLSNAALGQPISTCGARGKNVFTQSIDLFTSSFANQNAEKTIESEEKIISDQFHVKYAWGGPTQQHLQRRAYVEDTGDIALTIGPHISCLQ